MKKSLTFCSVLLAAAPAAAEDIQGVNRVVCASGQAQICLETGDCYEATPFELAVPEFIVIDIKKKTLSTTDASNENRTSKVTIAESADGLLILQGIENNRAFSFVIHEGTGRMTASVSRDGLTVTVFGACTDADL